MKNAASIIAAFLGGAIIGTVLGVLFAPDSGEETRKKIIDELEKRGIKRTKPESDDLVDEVNLNENPDAK